MSIYFYVRVSDRWIYHNADLWLITISDWAWNDITIADKNLWATTVYNNGDTLSESNCWKFYQWGNNYWFPYVSSITRVNQYVNDSWYWPNNYFSSSTFSSYGTTWEWRSTKNNDLWGNVTDTLVARRWPCSEWYHIPSMDDLTNFKTLLTSLWVRTYTWLLNYCKIPPSWYLDSTWSMYYAWTWAYIHGSYIYSTNSSATWLYIYYSSTPMIYNITVAWWSSVRPFKNKSVTPDDTRTKLY